MNTVFPARLSALRRERGLTQKDAAAAMGISGALLSHYEKGIRECGLDFLCAAAAFYDVSCDYLLGVSNTRRAFNEQFDERDTVQDREFRTGTLFRAATMLSDALAAVNPAAADLLRSYFALAIYRVALQAHDEGVLPAEWVSLPTSTAEALSAALMVDLMQKLHADTPEQKPKMAKPVCVQTIVENSEQLLRRALAPFTQDGKQ